MEALGFWESGEKGIFFFLEFIKDIPSWCHISLLERGCATADTRLHNALASHGGTRTLQERAWQDAVSGEHLGFPVCRMGWVHQSPWKLGSGPVVVTTSKRQKADMRP